MENKKQIATLSPLHFLYTTPEATLRLQTLTYLQFKSSEQLFKTHQNLYYLDIVKSSLTTPSDISLLTPQSINEIYNLIVEYSFPTDEHIKQISQALDVRQDEKYHTKDYMSCLVCQEKGLDKRRNCPLLDKSFHDKSVKYVINDSYILKECPVYPLHYEEYVRDALELLSILKLGVLPLGGGIMEQTPFVYTVSKMLQPIIESSRLQLNSIF